MQNRTEALSANSRIQGVELEDVKEIASDDADTFEDKADKKKTTSKKKN